MSEGISIIIPTLNGGSVFARCLEMIGKQNYGNSVQLIVIDSGSTDGSDILAENAGAIVKRIDRRLFHHARTRNQALDHAAFDRVIFMVQDAVPCSEDWLSGMTHALENPGVAAAFAAQLPHLDATPYARFETESVAHARLRAPELGNIHSMESFQALPYHEAYRRIGLDNVCAIYQKELLEKTPFPEVEFAEDLAWALKISLLDHPITYLPHVQIRHSHNRSPNYGFRRQIVNSYWLARIMKRVGEDFSFLSLRDLAFSVKSVSAFVLEKLNQKPKGIETFRPKDLFLNHLWKQYPLIFRMGVRRIDPSSSKYSNGSSSKAQAVAQGLIADTAYQLELIEKAYPPRDGQEWRQVLEQIATNILGRMHGEVYASCILKRSVPRQLEKFIKPFLSGV